MYISDLNLWTILLYKYLINNNINNYLTYNIFSTMFNNIGNFGFYHFENLIKVNFIIWLN